jgi:hypothetical protein
VKSSPDIFLAIMFAILASAVWVSCAFVVIHFVVKYW